jgi:hypothetical protein
MMEGSDSYNPAFLDSVPKSRSLPQSAGLVTSRSTSSHKLLARGGATIEEDIEEDDGGFGVKARKESLMELFSSDPSLQETPPGKRASSPIKRTVPAVVLGTPPPHAPNAQPARQPAVQAPTAHLDVMDNLAITANGRSSKPKSKSEARELADFFNSTPPPDPSASQQRTDPPHTGKSVKGFRGFMSKVTGKKSKDIEDR